MPLPDEPFVFAAPLLRSDSGFLKQHYLPIPLDISDAFHEAGVKRLIVVLNGTSYRRALLGRLDGERFIYISQSVMKAADISLGDMVELSLSADPEPDRIDIPEELVIVLEDDEPAARRFYSMTPGKQRGLSHYISSAKREATRIKRSFEIAEKLRTYTLYGDKKKDAEEK